MVKKRNSFGIFLKAVFQKWGWLVGSGVGLIQTTVALAGVYPNIPWWVGIIVLVVCLFIAMYLAYRDLHIKLQLEIEKPTSLNLQHRHPMSGDTAIIDNLNNQIVDKHSHDDYDAIHREFYDGYSTDDIMNHNCTKCGKPRNRQGDSIDGRE